MSSTIQIQSILFKNGKDGLIKSLENLANAVRVDAGRNVSQAVLLWGDASPDPLFLEEEIQALNDQYGDRITVRYHFFHENTGTAKGHNRLAKMGKSTYIMVMNPDVIVNPCIFDQLIQPYGDTLVGLTEARQTPIEHHKQYDAQTGETSWASTACVIFPRAVYDEVGGFDEKTFFMYCDDLDFSWMIRLAGYKVIYVPAAVVFHDKSISTEAKWQPTNAERYYSAEAAVLLAHKWSRPERVRELLRRFEESNGEIERKVIAEYRKREKNGNLPQPVDPECRIGEFVGDNYGSSRFSM